MQDHHKPKQETMPHAQWVACWWSRAFTQMTAQAAAGRETVSFQSLLASFLNANRIAIEDTGRTAWTYEQEVWKDVAERCRRRDPHCRPNSEIFHVKESKRSRVASQVLSNPMQRSSASSRFSGNHGNAPKYPKGHGKGKQQHTFPPPPPPAYGKGGRM